jgi:hypothetical protein
MRHRLRRFWKAFVVLATVAGSIASVVALWPIFFPAPPPRMLTPPESPEPPGYFFAEKHRGGLDVNKTNRAHNGTVTLFAITDVSGTFNVSNLGDIGFVGAMCGPVQFTAAGGDNLLSFSMDDFYNAFDAVRNFNDSHPETLVFGQFFNLKFGDLKNARISLLTYIGIDFENEVGARVSRYYFTDTHSQFMPIIQSEYNEKIALLRTITDTHVKQQYDCRQHRTEFP